MGLKSVSVSVCYFLKYLLSYRMYFIQELRTLSYYLRRFKKMRKIMASKMTYGKIITNLGISMLVTFLSRNVLYCTWHWPATLLQLELHHLNMWSLSSPQQDRREIREKQGLLITLTHTSLLLSVYWQESVKWLLPHCNSVCVGAHRGILWTELCPREFLFRRPKPQHNWICI